MSWNYRVVKKTQNGETTYGIHECYYDENGNPSSITVEPMDPHGESIEELRDDLELMSLALTRPVLNFDDY